MADNKNNGNNDIKTENMSFEQANELLAKSVARLESGKLSLDESIEEYENASRLIALCSKILDECRGKITDINEHCVQLMGENENE